MPPERSKTRAARADVAGTRAERHVLSLVRFLAQSPEAVYDAWLDRDALGRWLFRTPGGALASAEVDPRRGGDFTIVETRGNSQAPHFGRYVTLERPRSLAFTFAVDRTQAPSNVKIALTPLHQGTVLTVQHEVEARWAEYAPMILAGWSRMLASLSAHLSLEAQGALSVSTLVEAPRAEVWQAWTTPDGLARWWGGADAPRPEVEQMQVAPGGGFRLRIAGPQGQSFLVRGTYRDVVPDERLVYDDVCEVDGRPFYEELLEVALAPAGKAQTLLTVTAPLAPAVRQQPEAMLDDLRIGWARGWADNLDALSATFAAQRQTRSGG
ncbi:MAG: SRPBCC domain-containing protein [Hyphomicrobiaceae bacterium]